MDFLVALASILPFHWSKDSILYTTMGGIHCPHSGAGCQDIRPMVHQGKAVSGDSGESGLPVISDWEPGRWMGLKYSQSSLKPEFT